MSVDTPAGERVDPGTQFDCAICCGSADDGAEAFLASYPAADDLALTPAEADGLLPLCDDCTEEVEELTVAWTAIERPPVGTAATIAESYGMVAEECSFCDGAVDDDPLLGLESWTTTGRGVDVSDGEADRIETHDTYALCPDCVSIFEEFLQGIGSE